MQCDQKLMIRLQRLDFVGKLEYRLRRFPKFLAPLLLQLWFSFLISSKPVAQQQFDPSLKRSSPLVHHSVRQSSEEIRMRLLRCLEQDLKALYRGSCLPVQATLVLALVLLGLVAISIVGPNTNRSSVRAQGPSSDSNQVNPCSTPSIFPKTGPVRPRAAVAPNSVAASAAKAPARSPLYFQRIYQNFLSAPAPDKVYDDGGIPATVPETEYDPDSAGCTASYQPDGPAATAGNAFFQSLGTNGRACITCHQPPNGLSVSVQNINDRLNAPNGEHDPIFAPVDGSDCPDLVPAANTSGAPLGGRTGRGSDFKKAHHLLLSKGLFRIFLGVPENADYTISVVSDPYGCNTTAPYDQSSTGGQEVSIYRRPLISGNLTFVTTTRDATLAATGQPNAAATDPVTGQPLCIQGGGESVCTDPLTNRPIGGNIMWDGREPDLNQQAIDATLGHAQATNPPTQAQVNQIVSFENGIYNAQIREQQASLALALNSAGGMGGPKYLYGYTPYAGQPSPTVGGVGAAVAFPPTATFTPTFFLYNAWQTRTDALSASIYRGQQIFNGMPLPDGTSRAFTVSNVAGLNNIATSPGNTLGPLKGGCAICHNQTSAGADSFPAAQHDIGIGGDSSAFGGTSPTTDLPIFKVACKSGSTTPFHGTTVTTNDPGLALITGKCADVGRFTVPQLRALASHPPYFSDGSAAALLDVVNFYNNRFNINLSAQDKQDLVNFLNSL
jgi:cytochrome c peroxidase